MLTFTFPLFERRSSDDAIQCSLKRSTVINKLQFLSAVPCGVVEKNVGGL
jgi:hypothetical protein